MTMGKSKFLLVAVLISVAPGLSGCEMIKSYMRANRAATKWEGAVEEITFQRLEKDGKVFDIELHSRIDAPIAEVWEALKKPENLADNSEQYKLSKLLRQEGDTKDLELHVLALDNLQQFKIRLAFDDANHRVTISTLESTLADISGSYELKPSPDGSKTLYIYKATQTDKVMLPISTDVQRSAVKESFVSQVNAIKKQLKAG